MWIGSVVVAEDIADGWRSSKGGGVHWLVGHKQPLGDKDGVLGRTACTGVELPVVLEAILSIGVA